MNDSGRFPTFRKDEPPPASNLNGVLGPVMTGPSNSHTADLTRLGRMNFDLCGEVSQADICSSKGWLSAATLMGQASNRRFAAGLFGWDCANPSLSYMLECADLSSIRIRFHGVDETFDYPNQAVIIRFGPGSVLSG